MILKWGIIVNVKIFPGALALHTDDRLVKVYAGSNYQKMFLNKRFRKIIYFLTFVNARFFFNLVHT